MTLPLKNVPLFPLPGMVLFPGQALPLRIFEPRYRTMTRDVLDGERRICMVHLPQREGRSLGDLPPFAQIAGVGRVVQCEQLTDGRYNLVLLGEARVRVVERPFEGPYRRGDLTVLMPELSATPNGAEARALAATAARFVAAIREAHPEVQFELPSAADPGALADACAEYFVDEAPLRQTLLEELNEVRRLSLCLELLMRRLAPQGDVLN